MTEPGKTEDLLLRAKAGDAAALGGLFARYRDRLRRMVRLRLDRRVAGRLDPSDVVQEAYLDVARRFPEYAAAPAVPFYVWLRALTGQRLIDLHRQHLDFPVNRVHAVNPTSAPLPHDSPCFPEAGHFFSHYVVVRIVTTMS